MRQVNIRLTDEEYDALVRECGPGATVSGYVTVLVRRYFESSGLAAAPDSGGSRVVTPGAPVGGKKPGATPFTKDQQLGKGKRR